MRVFGSLNEFKAAKGEPIGPSDWITISQEQINGFADSTGDHQWIHTSPELAKDGPFGTTIAHGYLTLALLPAFAERLYKVEGLTMGLNYGANKLRFPAVVKCGSRIRGVGEVIAAEDLGPGGIQATYRITIEIEGGDKPACVIDKLARYYAA